MKKKLLLLLALVASCIIAKGQVFYSLPQTSLQVKVKVKKTVFIPGPLAAYAEKYLGVEATRSNSTSYAIEELSLTSSVEADPALSIALNFGGIKNASANFLTFSAYGLLVAPGYFSGGEASVGQEFTEDDKWSDNIQAVSNLATKTTNLYRSVQNEAGEIEKVAVPQTQVIEKTPEQRAEETAALIFKLRQKRIDILTGETDASYYSGEALGAAMQEIARLENDYTSLFVGKTFVSRQEASFSIVPKAKAGKQTYVIFRISDTEGVVPADNMAGRPVYLELTSSKEIDGEIPEAEMAQARGKIWYRQPLVVTAKVIDNQKVMGLCRVPVYQFGTVYPVAMETIFK